MSTIDLSSSEEEEIEPKKKKKKKKKKKAEPKRKKKKKSKDELELDEEPVKKKKKKKKRKEEEQPVEKKKKRKESVEEIEIETKRKSEVFFDRGNQYRKDGKHEKAVDELSKAIEIRPQDHRYYNRRGNSYNKIKGKCKEAMEDLNRAIELNPRYSGAYNNRGITYRKMKKFDLSIKDLSKAIEISPRSYHYHNNRGFTYFKMGDDYVKNAIDDYTKEIELNPNNHITFKNRGNAFKEMKKYDDSIEDYQRAIDIKSDYKDAKKKLEEVRKLKEKEEEEKEKEQLEFEIQDSFADEENESDEEFEVEAGKLEKLREFVSKNLKKMEKKHKIDLERMKKEIIAEIENKHEKNISKLEKDNRKLSKKLEKYGRRMKNMEKENLHLRGKMGSQMDQLKKNYEDHYDRFHCDKYSLVKSSVTPRMFKNEENNLDFCFVNEIISYELHFSIESGPGSVTNSLIDFQSLSVLLNGRILKKSFKTEYEDNVVEFSIKYTEIGRNRLTCQFHDIEKTFILDAEPCILSKERIEILLYRGEMEPNGLISRLDNCTQPTEIFTSGEDIIQIVVTLLNENGLPLPHKYLGNDLDFNVRVYSENSGEVLKKVFGIMVEGENKISKNGEFVVCTIGEEEKLRSGTYVVKVYGDGFTKNKKFEIKK